MAKDGDSNELIKRLAGEKKPHKPDKLYEAKFQNLKGAILNTLPGTTVHVLPINPHVQLNIRHADGATSTHTANFGNSHSDYLNDLREVIEKSGVFKEETTERGAHAGYKRLPGTPRELRRGRR